MKRTHRFWEQAQSWEELVRQSREVATDLEFASVRAWKEETGGKAVGCFPVYTPQELITAAGALPVSLYGGRGQMEIDRADSRIQSFVCSIVRSTLELGLAGRLEWMDAFVVPSICDVARNGSGVWQHNFPGQRTIYLHLPQNVEAESAGVYYRGELERLRAALEELTGEPVGEPGLRAALEVHNRNRELLAELDRRRVTQPARWPASQLWALGAAGQVLPKEEHNALLERALELGEARTVARRDFVRVLVRGAFCEQPPIEMLEVLEEAGCAIVDDDLQIGARFFDPPALPLSAPGDGLDALVAGYRRRTVLTPVNNPGARSRSADLLGRCREKAVQGVVFASPKFCEPALYDAVLLKQALTRAAIPVVEFEYEEKMTVFESVRLQAETFVESVLFFT